MVVMDARQRVDGVRGRARAASRPWPRRWTCRAVAGLAFWARLDLGIDTPALRGPKCADGHRVCRGCSQAVALTKPTPHALFPPAEAGFAKAGRAPPPKPRIATGTDQDLQCIAIAHTPAAHCARATSARPCGCPAGATASATMAACCSSTCATITASRRSWPIPTARRSSWPRRCARNGWCASTARCASARPAPRTRNCRPAQVEVYIDEIEVLGPAAELPMPVFGEAGLSGRDPAQIPLPRSAPREAARQHHAAWAGDRTRSAGA